MTLKLITFCQSTLAMTQQPVNETGNIIDSLTASLSVGRKGPLLLQDQNFQDFLSDFVQQKNPERIVHANGTGALGHFVLTNPNLGEYTSAGLFTQMGVEVPVMARFSTTVLETGSSDGVEDMRGFAVKFYTSGGNYDLLMLNIKAFNIRDPILFPSIGRSRMRHPETFVLDPDTYWDFTSLRPEVTFGTLLSFSDAGRMRNYREMKGFALNTFKWTGGLCGEDVFVKYHMLNDDVQEPVSTSLTSCPSQDLDHFRKDLYQSIKSNRFPTWTLHVQIMISTTPSTCTFDPFDPTKIWPEKEFPLIPVGKMTLNKNPTSFSEQVEKVAFHPGNLIPGIELSPDRVLHGRIFAYSVAQRHRLGRDANKIPVNCPLMKNEKTQIFSHGFNQVKYFPSSFNGIRCHGNQNGYGRRDVVPGDVVTRPDRGFEEDNYRQIDDYWRDEMSPEERVRTVKAVAKSLAMASPEIRERSFEKNWNPINTELSEMLRKEVEILLEMKCKL